MPSDSPKEVYEVYFVFACIWAFGGTLLQDQVCLEVVYRTSFQSCVGQGQGEVKICDPYLFVML